MGNDPETAESQTAVIAGLLSGFFTDYPLGPY